jgi:hypothetical protein
MYTHQGKLLFNTIIKNRFKKMSHKIDNFEKHLNFKF